MKLIITAEGYHVHKGACGRCGMDIELEEGDATLVPCHCGKHGVCEGCFDDWGGACWCGDVADDGLERHLYADL